VYHGARMDQADDRPGRRTHNGSAKGVRARQKEVRIPSIGEADSRVVSLEPHVPFVRDRLKRAGIRLADLLNRTLGQ